MLSAMQHGIYFFDRKPVKAPIVYLTEQPPSSFLKNLESASADGLEDLHYTSIATDLYGKPWAERLDLLRRKIDRTGARYVVLDTFSPCLGIIDENELNYAPILDLQKLAYEMKTGILFTQHTVKRTKFSDDLMDSMRGSGSIGGQADIGAYLHNPSGDQARARIRWAKMIGRIELPEPFTLVYENSRYRFGKYLQKSDYL